MIWNKMQCFAINRNEMPRKARKRRNMPRIAIKYREILEK